MKKSPLSLVKERFESKDKLVAAVKALASSDLWLDRVNSNKGLDLVSNAKLLRLHAVLTDAKQRFGSRAKLVTEIQALEKRSKDPGYAQRLEQYPLPRLLDIYGAASRSSSRAAKAAKAAKA